MAEASLVLLLIFFSGVQCCPDRCQCFTPARVFCSDDRLSSLPGNMSEEVREVIVMTTSLAYLFSDTFQENPQITKLVFLNNNLRSVHSTAFQSLTQLKELEISGNIFLEHLFLGTFSSQQNLTTLLLNFNAFKTFLPGMFDSLKQLETLQLKSNSISELPALLFLHLNKLQHLDLSRNKLSNVTKETFYGLENLEILKLNHNLLANLTSDAFQRVLGLTELHLEGNKITQLSDDVFSPLTNLSVLNLRGNSLTAFGVGVFGSGSSSLRELNLKGNKLTQISPLNSVTSLAHLTLSSNYLSGLPRDIFTNATSLEDLDLSENQLTSLDPSVFKGLSKISVLNLHRNNLTELDANLFESQRTAERLYLSENHLENLPAGLLDPFRLQMTVRLHGNPWRCDCRMGYLHHWILQNSREVETLDRMVCEEPQHLKKQSMTSIRQEQLVCHLKQEETPELSACSLLTANNTMIIKCRVKQCSPAVVKVQLEQEGGGVTEHVLKESESPECTNATGRSQTIH